MQYWKYKEHKDAVFDEDGCKDCKTQYSFSAAYIDILNYNGLLLMNMREVLLPVKRWKFGDLIAEWRPGSIVSL